MRRLLAFCVVIAVAAVTPFARGVEPNKQKCLAANEEAQDLKLARKLLEAREKLAACAAATCPNQVRRDCAQWLNEVNAAMPSLVFEAKDGSGNDLSAVKVTMDGQPLTEKLDGGSLEVDPGEHRFTFEAAGLPASEKTVAVHEGEKNRRERIVIGGAAQTPSPQAGPSDAPSDKGTRRTIGYVVGGVGVVGLAVGSVFGVLALSNKSSLDSGPCGTGKNACEPSAQSKINSMNTDALVSDVSLGIGIVGVAVATYLLLTSSSETDAAPSTAAISPSVSLGSAGFAWRF